MTFRPLLILPLALVAGCSQSMKEIGKEPAMTQVGATIDPEVMAAYNYPKRPAPALTRYSLWDDKQSRLFTDARALNVGDILTVEISINDKARFKNESERSRDASRSLGLSGSYSVGGAGSSAAAEGQIGSGTSTTGGGQTERSENIRLLVAAVVTQVLSNGNLRIRGTQEVRVNAELRILTIEGIVRPSDINPQNMISYERIAEARISYGGRGRISEVQQPPYGQQFLDQVLPF
ncbi:flagellar basal body L-ring protein FlgH [Nitratireductor aquimarinus]|uniref:Flagellar L-ring protein n=1 Tax=Nitratireductor aquimarinus TaxID=889300 RepID=A0ABU4AGK0_9HYPH|nr:MULTISPECIES: flagellar basal body L-ring protein FlgH [Alphaproteobacteria]MBY6021678.1 flagellar basal body L-ring protein FlgH [Nitratireductor sp. DP7N14-4]MBN7756731.1 flagellar basal body L-ring protein FlgH [Nitratireductor aquimarinus]MBN7761912.1 flagellar basal body L-ring protein FlgH [Nitratireductor aquibiodomus]MBN7775176.1 flagellar basal body L-ring protein FlgH [Nitratireductor pacificus]MBN7781190.1 flagellar basal body L-ring protein FlgH [Nitratireductor pacificus]